MKKFDISKEEVESLKDQLKEIKVLEKKLTEIDPLKNRIKTLESNIRN